MSQFLITSNCDIRLSQIKVCLQELKVTATCAMADHTYWISSIHLNMHVSGGYLIPGPAWSQTSNLVTYGQVTYCFNSCYDNARLPNAAHLITL